MGVYGEVSLLSSGGAQRGLDLLGSNPFHSARDPVQLVAETKTENKIKILT